MNARRDDRNGSSMGRILANARWYWVSWIWRVVSEEWRFRCIRLSTFVSEHRRPHILPRG